MTKLKQQIQTLCILEKEGKVLLARKQRKIGKGLWNGYGGKVELGEEIEQAAIRELEEESNIKVPHLLKRGLIHFQTPDLDIMVHLFSDESDQQPQESAEMTNPTWFLPEDIPYKEMLAADQIWFPYFLSRKKFEAFFIYDKDWKLLKHSVRFIDR